MRHHIDLHKGSQAVLKGATVVVVEGYGGFVVAVLVIELPIIIGVITQTDSPWFPRRCSANLNITRNSSPWYFRGLCVPPESHQ